MRIGVDLGGTKIEAIALADDGSIVARERVSTPRDYDATIEAIASLVEMVESRAGSARGVGIGIPGVVDPANQRVKNANSVWLNGRTLGFDLAQRLARDVRLANDANCFALSEASDGAGVGARVVFGVILGTGVGGGIVVDGRVLEGINLIAGEWGHNPLPWPEPDEYPGPECYCGKRGCIEMWCSGPGFAADYARCLPERREGSAASPAEIVRSAANGDTAAREALTRYHSRLARALASVINVLDPDVVVLGGGMSNIPRLEREVTPLLPKWVFSDRVVTRVVRNAHGDSSGVRGAAWLWP